MNRPVGFILLGVVGLAVLGLPFILRKPEAIQAPPSQPLTPTRAAPVPVPLPRPSSQPRGVPSPEESGDPILNRWRAAVRQRNAGDVVNLQSLFVTREADYKEPLMKMARDEPDPRIRAFTVAVLGRLRTPPPEEYFLERTGDPHEYPRTSALEALEKVGTRSCLSTADRLASGDPAEAVRAAAVQTAKAVRSR